MSRISVIVVAYNVCISSIPVLKAAESSPSVNQIIICDNSTDCRQNESLSHGSAIEYVPMNGNKGLAAAYQEGVRHSNGDIVCLFDDDTAVGEDYFAAVASLADSEKTWDVALPLVMSGSTVLSPCMFSGFKARAFRDSESVMETSSLSGINSGMAVKRSLFDYVQHDRSLFLDLIDHQFISDAKRTGAHVVYLSGPTLNQDYSLESDSAESALRRLAIFEKDARTFYASSPVKRLYCEAMLAVRKAKLCLRYKSFVFFRTPARERKGL